MAVWSSATRARHRGASPSGSRFREGVEEAHAIGNLVAGHRVGRGVLGLLAGDDRAGDGHGARAGPILDIARVARAPAAQDRDLAAPRGAGATLLVGGAMV